MTNRVILKRSSTANSVPIGSDLEYGELALNYTDGNLFFKTASNAVSLLSSTKTANYSGNVTANYFIGNANIQYTASVGPPSGNLIGAQWYDTGSDVLYEYQTDGTSTYWVDITGPTVGPVVSVTGNYGNSNVAVFLAAFGSNAISTTGNANVGNAHVGNLISDNILGLNAVFNGSVAVQGAISITGNTIVGNISATSAVITSSLKTTAVAYGSLPLAATAGAGARSFITDGNLAATGNFGSLVTGSAGNSVPVYSDGTDWRIG